MSDDSTIEATFCFVDIAGLLRAMPSARRIATRAASVALVAFGVRLAIANR
jgi:threonine/homoserine/homoserine lactone efflux protein